MTVSATKSAAKKPVTARKSVARKPAVKKTDDVLLTILLDRSGSMDIIRDATIKGFNDFIATQRDDNQKGRLLVSLVQFDTAYEPNFEGIDIANNDIVLDHNSYVPRGGTALLDSLARSIADTEKWIKTNKFSGRVIFLVITDGEENSSREYALSQDGHKRITHLVSEKETKNKWSFAYVGANVDAFGESTSMGFASGSSLQAASNPASVDTVFMATSSGLSNYRSSGASGQSASGSFYDNPSTHSVLTAAAASGVTDTYLAKDEDTGTLKPQAKSKKSTK